MISRKWCGFISILLALLVATNIWIINLKAQLSGIIINGQDKVFVVKSRNAQDAMSVDVEEFTTSPIVEMLPQVDLQGIGDSLDYVRINAESWNTFASTPTQQPKRQRRLKLSSKNMNICSNNVVKALSSPRLSNKSFEWCNWALQPTGGKVQVGKSYGILNKQQRDDYEQLNCNAVLTGSNPACDDAWGDKQIISWKSTPTKSDLCNDMHSRHEHTSKIKCYDSQSLARFCMFENVMFDMKKMHKVSRPGMTPSRSWDPGFLASDCAPAVTDINFYPFYRPTVNPNNTQCDVVFPGVVLAYSHDNIKNLGHTMSDFMNVWAMLWMSGTSQYSQDISFFNIDALRMGHSYDDEPNHFFSHYTNTFARVLKAKDYEDKQLCFKQLIMQPRPLLLFTWDGWWQDMPCTLVGPSSLFQRWNIQIRQSYHMLPSSIPKANNEVEDLSVRPLNTDNIVQILLIVRNANKKSTSKYTSRVFSNVAAIEAELSTIKNVTLVVQDLAVLSFEDQITLIANSSLVIGMHGAGIASAMHMAIGTKYCCGVIEIFPEGEFKPIRGYGNMARRMGHHYERLFLSRDNSAESGGFVPLSDLMATTNKVLHNIYHKPTCVMPSVIEDPYFESVPSWWSK